MHNLIARLSLSFLLFSCLDKPDHLNYWYARDKNYVYSWGEKIVNSETNEPSHGESFEILEDYFDYGYARDKNFGYCYGMIIPESDGSTFEYLGESKARDSNNEYLYCQIQE